MSRLAERILIFIGMISVPFWITFVLSAWGIL